MKHVSFVPPRTPNGAADLLSVGYGYSSNEDGVATSPLPCYLTPVTPPCPQELVSGNDKEAENAVPAEAESTIATGDDVISQLHSFEAQMNNELHDLEQFGVVASETNETRRQQHPDGSAKRVSNRKLYRTISGKTTKIMSDYQAYLAEIDDDDPVFDSIEEAKDDIRSAYEDQRLAAAEEGGGDDLAGRDDDYASGAGAPLYRAWSPAVGEEPATGGKYAHAWLRSRKVKRSIALISLTVAVVIGVSVIATNKAHKNLPDWEEYSEGKEIEETQFQEWKKRIDGKEIEEDETHVDKASEEEDENQVRNAELQKEKYEQAPEKDNKAKIGETTNEVQHVNQTISSPSHSLQNQVSNAELQEDEYIGEMEDRNAHIEETEEADKEANTQETSEEQQNVDQKIPSPLSSHSSQNQLSGPDLEKEANIEPQKEDYAEEMEESEAFLQEENEEADTTETNEEQDETHNIDQNSPLPLSFNSSQNKVSKPDLKEEGDVELQKKDYVKETEGSKAHLQEEDGEGDTKEMSEEQDEMQRVSQKILFPVSSQSFQNQVSDPEPTKEDSDLEPQQKGYVEEISEEDLKKMMMSLEQQKGEYIKEVEFSEKNIENLISRLKLEKEQYSEEVEDNKTYVKEATKGEDTEELQHEAAYSEETTNEQEENQKFSEKISSPLSSRFPKKQPSNPELREEEGLGRGRWEQGGSQSPPTGGLSNYDMYLITGQNPNTLHAQSSHSSQNRESSTPSNARVNQLEEKLYSYASEKYMPVIYDRYDGWTGRTYVEALVFCEETAGLAICPYEAVCPNGVQSMPLGGYRQAPHGDWAWIPVMDAHNAWVQAAGRDSCIRYSDMHGMTPDWGTTGLGNEGITQNIMCCLGGV